MIKPWVFEFFAPPADFDSPPGAANRNDEVSAWYLDLWTDLETWGFEGIFFSEHHFVPGRLSPSPHLLIAAMSQRTRTLRLGAMGVVLPLYEPWRVAEEIAMLDMLTGGRLEVGMASGSAPMEYRALGIASEDVRPRFEEALDIVQQALAASEVTYDGKFFKFDKLVISPRPVQQPPPQWIPVTSPGSAAMAARHGCRICAGFYSTQDLQPVFDEYRDTAGAGVSGEDLAIRRMVFLSDDAGEAQEMAANTVSTWRKILQGPSGKKDTSTTGLPNADARQVPDAPAGGGAKPAVSDQEAIAGAPADVAEQIIAQCRELGAGHILGYLFGSVTREQIRRNYELWQEVIPILRKAALD